MPKPELEEYVQNEMVLAEWNERTVLTDDDIIDRWKLDTTRSHATTQIKRMVDGENPWGIRLVCFKISQRVRRFRVRDLLEYEWRVMHGEQRGTT